MPLTPGRTSLGDGPTDPEPEGAADADAGADGVAVAEPPAEALGDGLGDALGDGLGDGLADGSVTTEGDGVGDGRSPTGSGPTKTNAARIPTATSTPASRPARIVTPDLIRRQGTSTDEPRARPESRC